MSEHKDQEIWALGLSGKEIRAFGLSDRETRAFDLCEVNKWNESMRTVGFNLSGLNYLIIELLTDRFGVNSTSTLDKEITNKCFICLYIG